MIVIIIMILIIVVVYVRFSNARKKQNNRIRAVGGMRVKYAVLIEYLKADIGKIITERSDVIYIGFSNVDGSTVYMIVDTFTTVTVQWKVQSRVFGTHKLEWEFPQGFSQNLMWEKIKIDGANYQTKLFQKFL